MKAAPMKPIRIQRLNDAELDVAIKDLEKRGFKLLNRGASGYTISQVNYRPSSRSPFKARSYAEHSLRWAILRKEDESAVIREMGRP